MKVKSLIIFILISFGFALSAQDLLFFQGIGAGLGKYKDTLLMPMDEQMEYMTKYLKPKTTENEPPSKVIIAHSQGGLRAVGLTGYIKENDVTDINIKSVITIGAPIKGFSPLSKGVGNLRNEIRGAINIITSAISSANKKLDSGQDFTEESILEGLGLQDSFMDLIVNTANTGDTTSLKGMTPNSDFINKNIGSFGTVTKPIRIKINAGRGGIRYKTIYITENIEKVHLPTNIDYGFIVGKNSDILELAYDISGLKKEMHPSFSPTQHKILPHIANDLFQKWLFAAALLHRADETSHRIWQNIHWLKWWDHSDYRREKALGDACARNAVACDRGAAWAKNCSTNYSKILGTTKNEHDCFIPSKDQYLDINKFGGKAIDNLNGYFESSNLNHLTEKNSSEIWGNGGNIDSGKVGTSGVISDWLDAAGVDIAKNSNNEEIHRTGIVVR